ncbi:MAG: anti-sigma factor [Acidobacteriota bacterium]|jgi:hypothetical protein
MKCADFVDRMDDYLDLALPQSEQQNLEAHLAECVDCRERVRSIKSLLCQSAALPKSINPDHDLWPAILPKIHAAGIPQTNIARPVRFQWSWRLTAVVVAGAALVLAATLFLTHHPESQSISSSGSSVLRKTGEELPAPRGQQPRLPAITGTTESAKNGIVPSEDSGASIGRVMNSTACQCEPSAEILGVVENALLVDESLPDSRSAEVVSDRLFNLARENEDDFFLLKSSLEVLPFPSRVPDSVRDRYRRLLLQHPGEAGLTYLYAFSLYGKNTPEMIRLMKQLIAENPSFPWPNFALAKVYGFPNMPVDMSRSGYIYNDPNKVQTYLRAFMELCPESPEPIRILISVTDPLFFSSTLSHMRELLVTRTDTRSLLMYPALWSMETTRQAGDAVANQTWQWVSADLKRLLSLAGGRPPEFLSVLWSGYRGMGDMETLRILLAKDTSIEGRSAFVAFDTQEWSANNPAPAADATVQTKTAYWEKRLQRTDIWIKKAPEFTFVWMDRLKSLSELKNHPETEFTGAGEKVLSLLRGGADSLSLDFMKLATLYANRGVRLDQIPSLIREGLAAVEKRDLENANDLKSPGFNTEMGRFLPWQYADDAWHALFDAYLRIAEIDRARSALDEVEKGMTEWRNKIATMQANTQVNNSYSLLIVTDGLLAREKWLNEARGRLALKKK